MGSSIIYDKRNVKKENVFDIKFNFNYYNDSRF